ncbi:MAG: hypothetical protein J6R37_03435 [Clostridia bacterium]|nr:hypothetical protein [Clostridia bacterium]
MKRTRKRRYHTTRTPITFAGIEQQFVGNPMLLGGIASFPNDSTQIDKKP